MGRALAACQEALTLATTSGDRELYDDDEYYSRQSLSLPFVPGVADVDDNKEFLKNVMKMRYAVSTRESEGNKEIIWGLSNQFDFYSRYPLRILKKSDGTELQYNQITGKDVSQWFWSTEFLPRTSS